MLALYILPATSFVSALAFASLAAELTDGGAAAALALASSAAVLADAEAAAALACASLTAVLTDACASAFTAQVLLALVGALLLDSRHFQGGDAGISSMRSALDR
jgi:hypothetical protein